MAKTAEKVYDLIKPAVENEGVILWDVRFLKEGASHYLRVFIFKPEGIGIEDCTNVSRAIDPIIDEADPISVSYYLEVCSAGIEAELTRVEHYELLKGKTVTVKLYKEYNGQKQITGTLLGYEEGPVLALENGERAVIAKEEISKAFLTDNQI